MRSLLNKKDKMKNLINLKENKLSMLKPMKKIMFKIHKEHHQILKVIVLIMEIEEKLVNLMKENKSS